MIYADTDFFLALFKEADGLKQSALRLLEQYKGLLWTSPTTLIELLLFASESSMDPQKLLVDVLAVADLRGGDAEVFLTAAGYMAVDHSGVFESLHAAFCRPEYPMISSDKVFDRLGMQRVPLGDDAKAA
jgi:predicted nucleic acid-binding protein